MSTNESAKLVLRLPPARLKKAQRAALEREFRATGLPVQIEEPSTRTGTGLETQLPLILDFVTHAGEHVSGDLVAKATWPLLVAACATASKVFRTVWLRVLASDRPPVTYTLPADDTFDAACAIPRDYAVLHLSSRTTRHWRTDGSGWEDRRVDVEVLGKVTEGARLGQKPRPAERENE
jgi:hypothetical protein